MKAKEKKDISVMVKNLSTIRKDIGWELAAKVDELIKKQLLILKDEIDSEFQLKEDAKKYNV